MPCYISLQQESYWKRSNAVNSIVITDPGVGFTASDTVTVTLDAGTQNKTFTVGVTTVDEVIEILTKLVGK